MADPTFKNPATGGVNLAGGGKPLLRVYSGHYPEDGDYPEQFKRSVKGVKYYWDENLKGLGANFNADEWEEAGQVRWARNPQTGKYEIKRAGEMGILSPDIDPYEGQSAEFQAALLKNRSAGVTGNVADPSTSRPAKITPADVKAAAKESPAAAAQQKSVAEQQAEYIRSKGGRTAAEADAEFESNLRKDYSEATGFDINTAEGRRKSFQAALQRGGHANARALNMRAGKYAYLDPNSDAGMKARDTAYQKAWGPQGEFDKGIRAGVNPLTGQYKATLDGPAYGSKELYDTFRGAEDEATDYADNAINAALNPEPTFSWEQPNFDAAADAIRLRGGNPTQQQEAPSPLQASSDAAQKRIRDAFVTGTSQPEASKNIMPAFDKLDASLKTAADAVRNIGRDTWTPEKGGYKGGVWYSAADSEPEAGGNYGTPRLFDTWTPQAGGRVNNVNYSRADSEPQAGGNHGKPLLFPSTTRPIMQPSRAALLGPRAKPKPITPWQGYGDQM